MIKNVSYDGKIMSYYYKNKLICSVLNYGNDKKNYKAYTHFKRSAERGYLANEIYCGYDRFAEKNVSDYIEDIYVNINGLFKVPTKRLDNKIIWKLKKPYGDIYMPFPSDIKHNNYSLFEHNYREAPYQNIDRWFRCPICGKYYSNNQKGVFDNELPTIKDIPIITCCNICTYSFNNMYSERGEYWDFKKGIFIKDKNIIVKRNKIKLENKWGIVL